MLGLVLLLAVALLLRLLLLTLLRTLLLMPVADVSPAVAGTSGATTTAR